MASLKDRVFTKEQLREGTSADLPCNHQVGSDVWVWVSPTTHLPGIVQGVTISNKHLITYDVAFELGESGLYVVQYGLRENITKPGGKYSGDTLVEPEVMGSSPRKMVH